MLFLGESPQVGCVVSPAQITRLIQSAVYGVDEPIVSHSIVGFVCGEEVTKRRFSENFAELTDELCPPTNREGRLALASA